ncbi:hypothetical protein [Rhodococcus sp. HNM0569]|uniref:hypothetical protein n=1 Tax=Rhodococcus sp. HNM0569 TaxID=2716340 RepID=UPI00146F51F2|nr:hypothetical protein [Rhodococcus sp. HNM0569]NLU81627.1 hypothetical protein [Rhodococcus sp. HNM0569]
MTTFRQIQQRANELQAERERLVKIRRDAANNDRMMTASERAEYVEEWRKSIAKQLEPQFAALREEARGLAASTKRRAANARPKLDPSSAADLVRTEHAWRNSVLPQLERGTPLADALRNADADAVLGAERFAESWLRANQTRPAGLGDVAYGEDGRWRRPSDADGHAEMVAAAIAGRFADLTADPDDAAALRASVTVDSVITPAIDAYISEAESRPRVSLDTSIGTHYALGAADGNAEGDAA